MKNIIYSFLMMMLIFQACTKEVLDKKPLDIISDANVWNDPSLTNAYIRGIYGQLNFLYYDNPGSEGWVNPDMNGLNIADEAEPFWDSGGAQQKYGNLKIGGGLFDWWGYSTIRAINIALEKIPATTLPDNTKIEMLAEVRFLRALSYFQLVKLYGGVPLITSVQDINAPSEEIMLSRDTEEAIYNFVISEVDAISGDLPESWSADYGRATRYAALALKSRAALYAASIADFGTVKLDGVVGIPHDKAQSFYQQSYDASLAIINSNKFVLYDKLPGDKVKNFRQLFNENRNSEKIWVKAYVGGAAGLGHNFDFWNTPNYVHEWGGGSALGPYLEMMEEFEYVDGTPGTLDRAAVASKLWKGKDIWAGKDPRFYSTIYTQNSVFMGDTLKYWNGIMDENGVLVASGYYKGIKVIPQAKAACTGMWKNVQDKNSMWSNMSTNDIIVYRYGETLLNFAEAAFELGKSAEALDAINQIRARAGIALLTSIDREKIRHERKVELAFESHRYWDCRRWRIAVTELSKPKTRIRYILDYNTMKLIIKFDPADNGKTAAFFEQNYYIPIKLSRTANNPNLVENPGY